MSLVLRANCAKKCVLYLLLCFMSSYIALGGTRLGINSLPTSRLSLIAHILIFYIATCKYVDIFLFGLYLRPR